MRWLFSLFLLLHLNLFSKDVVFIVSHPNPALHFYHFSKALEKQGITSRFLAKNAAFEILDAKGVDLLSISNLTLESIAKACEKDSMVIVEVGDVTFPSLVRKIKRAAPEIKLAVYYDNYESFVPGGYSDTFIALSKEPLDFILFSNPKCLNLTKKEAYGIGFYPLEEVEKLKKARESKRENGLILYVGGASSYYYDCALPYFLKLLQEDSFKGVKLLYQQHPRAKLEGNVDLKLISEANLAKRGVDFSVSKAPVLDAASTADLILYSQTSMAPLFLLADIPTFQVAPFAFQDNLVKKGLVVALSPKTSFTASRESEKNLAVGREARVKEELGYSEEWESNLVIIIKRKLGEVVHESKR